jgi:bifunctional non-homologous end joining protein LigD
MVVCNDRGLAVFDLLRRGPQVKAGAFLDAFDLLELDGRDLRREPIEVRKAALAKLLRGAKPASSSASMSRATAPIIFEHACKLGCEGDCEQASPLQIPVRLVTADVRRGFGSRPLRAVALVA